MNKKLIKTTILAVASVFAFAPLALADDEGGKGKRPGHRPGGPARKAVMEKFDKDGNGKLDETEREAAREALKARGKERAAERFKKADTDNSGSLSLEEFTAGRPGKGKRGEEFFQRVDVNKDGELSPKELRNARRDRGPRGKRPGGPRGKGEGKRRPAVEGGDRGEG